MKIHKKIHLLLLLAIGVILTNNSAQAFRITFDEDPFWSDNVFADFDDIFDRAKEQIQMMQERFMDRGLKLSKEERTALKEARAKIKDIKAEITTDKATGNVIIKLPLSNVDGSAMKAKIKDNSLRVTLPAKFGKVELVITPHHLYVARHLEIRKEEKSEDANKPAQQTMLRVESLGTIVQDLPNTVDISSRKIVTKNNELTITLSPKKDEDVEISRE